MKNIEIESEKCYYCKMELDLFTVVLINNIFVPAHDSCLKLITESAFITITHVYGAVEAYMRNHKGIRAHSIFVITEIDKRGLILRIVNAEGFKYEIDADYTTINRFGVYIDTKLPFDKLKIGDIVIGSPNASEFDEFKTEIDGSWYYLDCWEELADEW